MLHGLLDLLFLQVGVVIGEVEFDMLGFGLAGRVGELLRNEAFVDAVLYVLRIRNDIQAPISSCLKHFLILNLFALEYFLEYFVPVQFFIRTV